MSRSYRIFDLSDPARGFETTTLVMALLFTLGSKRWDFCSVAHRCAEGQQP